MPGDFARIEADHKVTLLGRGSNCVNTGGEKVYPEEVEMAIKGHPPGLRLPRRLGLPDEKYGQRVAADKPWNRAASLGVQKAAVRNLVHSLDTTLKDDGIRAVSVTVRGTRRRRGVHRRRQRARAIRQR